MQIAILDDYHNISGEMADWSALPASAKLRVFNAPIGNFEAQVLALKKCQILCVMRERTPITAELMQNLPELKLIVTTGKRNSAIDLKAASARGITVCGTDSPGHATSELTMGLILALSRQIISENRTLLEGGWQNYLGRDLKGTTLGLAGLGRLGAQVARLGQAFGMHTIAWSENLTDERAAGLDTERVSKDELLQRSDFITIHLKLSARTSKLVCARELALMKPDACLINTSRGPIVDTNALAKALSKRRLGGAALDVFDVEPLPLTDTLRDIPNLILTPHIGYVTRETYQLFYRQTLEAVLAYLDGNPIRILAAP